MARGSLVQAAHLMVPLALPLTRCEGLAWHPLAQKCRAVTAPPPGLTRKPRSVAVCGMDVVCFFVWHRCLLSSHSLEHRRREWLHRHPPKPRTDLPQQRISQAPGGQRAL